MQTPFGKWLQNAQVPSDAAALFEEACVCFGVGAHRAALLLSYMAWGTTLRTRLLSATCPAAMLQGQWDNIHKQLRDDDTWDSQVFDTTQQKKGTPIFLVSDSLRQQVVYWKDRRNDCAHAKDNAIAAAHVEAFWLFIQSNLGKFVPNGSKEELWQRFARHYDPNLTAPGTPVDPIVALVPSAVPSAELPAFIKELVRPFTGDNTFFGSYYPLSDMLEGMLRLSVDSLHEAIVSTLADSPELLAEFLRFKPHRTAFWHGHPTLVRRLWRELLQFKGSRGGLRVFAAMLRNNMIPATELPEACDWVASRVSGEIPHQDDVPILVDSGFFASFRKHCFVGFAINQFGWGNPNAPLVGWYVEFFTLDEEVVRTICDVFYSDPYPFEAHHKIVEVFQRCPAKHAEFLKLAEEHELSVPAAFK